MRKLPQSLFDVYALSLPRGHGFGNRPPVEAWQSEDGFACGVVTNDQNDGSFGVLVLRRRVDQVWALICEEHGLTDLVGARFFAESMLKEGAPPETIPANSAPRPALHDAEKRKPSEIFRMLAQPSHHVAAWLLNQVYLALPNPDRNWAGDCQTGNFHTRLWEAQLLACFREQGLLVTQPYTSPDFRIENRHGGEAWVEAVTANPPVPYNHASSQASSPPEDKRERLFGRAAVRFAKTLGNKLQRRYDCLPHVAGKPFVIALADFHAPSSMVWSREALICYLYGMYPEVIDVAGGLAAVPKAITHLLGGSAFPAGLFGNADHNELSAVVFTNACSMGKFNRVGVSAGASTNGFRYVRIGKFYDRTPGVLEGISFCLDVASNDYRELWPQGYEPWSAELEIFHNPFARHPMRHELLPEATHWFEANGEVLCESHYATSILWSRTLIQDEGDPIPMLSDIESPPATIV